MATIPTRQIQLLCSKTCFYLLMLVLPPTGFAVQMHAQPSKALQQLCDKVVQNYVKPNDISYGIAIGIIDGTYVYQYYYGKISGRLPQPPDSSTLFLLGSVSKVITTSVMAVMDNEKQISVNDTITRYLPDSVAANPYLSSVTLKKLATHTALLPKTPYNLPATLIQPEDTYGNYQLTDLYRFLLHYRPTSAVFKKKNSKQFVYSHTGIGLLAHLLENASGKPFDSLIVQKLGAICGGLPNTAARLTLAQQNRLAPGHRFTGTEIPEVSFASMYGSEGLYANLPDMLRFTNACMRLKIFEPALEPRFNTQMPDVKVGWGWYVIMDGKRQPAIYTHSGKTAGYSNYIAFEKERQVAVVVLSNSDNRIDKIGIDLLDLLLR
ncbi:hypothetical protein C7N43_22475 [Sphingobacteriales bacterium UPWRP_1]|nr:hypothetical protein B6N25_06260 [Sphingobacteriales bacterium TSM_CSS]PSJ74715.1 hypothetical protein C7N43_22475 [Sphingobacteriales bacterium UPWRP_1]